jgi:fungal STAND N-terminal Goodbye domain
MATLSESTFLESLFQSALEEYEKQTGIELARHPLAIQLERCNTVESITEVLQDQARAFREFRGDDNKILTLLKQAAQILHKLSATVVLGEAIGPVCRNGR